MNFPRFFNFDYKQNFSCQSVQKACEIQIIKFPKFFLVVNRAKFEMKSDSVEDCCTPLALPDNDDELLGVSCETLDFISMTLQRNSFTIRNILQKYLLLEYKGPQKTNFGFSLRKCEFSSNFPPIWAWITNTTLKFPGIFVHF